MTNPIRQHPAADESKAPGHLPAFSPEGVDLTLIRWMKSLTPIERLRALQRTAGAIQRLKNARTRA